MRLVHALESCGGIAAKHQLEEVANPAPVGEAEHVADLLGGDGAAAVGDRLVEDRESVASGAFGSARDHSQRIVLHLHALGFRHRGEMRDQLLGIDPSKVETLGPRQHRDRHLVHFGGREQEFHMFRRFLKSLEQGIERAFGKHVNFVDDVDFVTSRHRRVAHRVDDLAHIVHAGVRGGVHLDDVDMPAFGNRPARLADPAGLDRRLPLPIRPDAVQGLGDQPRGRGLSHSADTGEQECVSNPAALDGVGESLYHRVLPNQLVERLRAIFAGENAIRRSGACHFRQVEAEARRFVGHCAWFRGLRSSLRGA